MSIPLKLLYVASQLPRVGCDESPVQIPVCELLLDLQFVRWGIELLNIAIPLHLLPDEVQYLNMGCDEYPILMPFTELFIEVQFSNSGLEKS
jgi:hypothetical protein